MSDWVLSRQSATILRIFPNRRQRGNSSNSSFHFFSLRCQGHGEIVSFVSFREIDCGFANRCIRAAPKKGASPKLCTLCQRPQPVIYPPQPQIGATKGKKGTKKNKKRREPKTLHTVSTPPTSNLSSPAFFSTNRCNKWTLGLFSIILNFAITCMENSALGRDTLWQCNNFRMFSNLDPHPYLVLRFQLKCQNWPKPRNWPKKAKFEVIQGVFFNWCPP